MDPKLTFSFFIAAFLLALMPGPDNLLVLTESITKGKRNGIALSSGLSSGVIIHTLAIMTGLSLILQNSAIAFQAVKYLGAAYLFYLAAMTLMEEQQQLNFEEQQNDQYNFWKLYRQGFLMNVLNPKVTLFFIALLPQFVSSEGFSPSLQLFILGIIFMLTALITFSLIAILADKLRLILNKEGFWKWTKYSKVVVLIGLAILILLSEK
ncbi:MAG: LysE family translocator [Saprospiraceae bacterium]